MTVLCEPDFPYDDTWDRSGDGERLRMHRQIEADLVTRRIPFLRASGPVARRVQRLTELLAEVEPFTPVAELMGGDAWSGRGC